MDHLYLNELKEKLDGKKPTMQIITHDDMDGYGAAAVVFHAFCNAKIITKDDCTICHYNYSDKIPSIDKSADIVFITDYSISNEGFMNDLLESFTVGKQLIYWCDHHKTSIDNCTGKYEKLKDIPGIRNEDYCGTALAWFYLHPGKNKLPIGVNLIDDYDCWKKKNPNSDYLNAAFNFMGSYRKELHDPKSLMWKDLINEGSHVSELTRYGSDFCKMSKDQDAANIRRNGWIGILDKYPKLKLLCLNNDSKGSQLFSDLLKSKEFPNGKYTHACAFQFDGTQFVYSIYSADGAKPTAEEICKSYGGGGHPGAAGFQSPKIHIKKDSEIPEEYK